MLKGLAINDDKMKGQSEVIRNTLNNETDSSVSVMPEIHSEFLSTRKKRIESYYKNKLRDVELLIDNVWDIHNVSAIMRSADGFGIERINLYYTYDENPYDKPGFSACQKSSISKHNEFPNLKRQGKRASSSANKWLRFNKIQNLKKFSEEMKSRGFRFIAADMKKDAKNLISLKFPEKCVIIFGNEKDGISKELREICDDTVFIPMVGMVKSFNISVAASIILYELFRQKGKSLKLTDLSSSRN